MQRIEGEAHRARRGLAALVAVALVVVAGPSALPAGAGAPAASGGPDGAVEAVPGELLVAFDPTLPPSAKASLRARHGLDRAAALPVPGLEQVRIPDGERPEAAAARLSGQLGVRYAEPNFVVHPTGTFPDDPFFDEQWGLHNTGGGTATRDADIDAPEAWDLAADTSPLVVAVIDTGVDISHPDLAANVWTNPDEIPGNGKDDDRNGYVDDVNGWDFHNDDETVYDAADDDIHGTHVAGIIAAEADNATGIAGVSQVQLMPLKFLGPDGGSTADAVRAIDYAIDKGAHVTNNSWGGPTRSQALADAITRADRAGQLLVASSGNGGSDGSGDDLDAEPIYPAALPHENIIAVTATDDRDQLPSFANYGATTVDLGAPGVRIASTVPGGTYAGFSGTSMAAPHVTGAVAHVTAAFPGLSHTEVRARILASGDPADALVDTTVTGDRLNLAGALAAEDPTAGDGTTGDGTTGDGTTETEAEAGDTVSTHPAGTTASAEDPVVLELTTPVAGTVTLTLLDAVDAVTDHRMLAAGVDITAPEATASDPLVLDIDLAAAALPHDAPLTSVRVFRDGAPVPTCDGDEATSASPDPCVSDRSAADDVVSLEVLTSAASTWSFGVPTVDRLAGDHRLATAVAASRASFGDGGAGAAVLARSDAFPDALAGAGLAVAQDGPLLLTPSDRLHDVVADELDRILAVGDTVHLLGGTAAIDPAVADELRALGYRVQRHAGADRFATAVAIAEATAPAPAHVLLTTGTRFPDALTASAAAAAVGGVVVLTNGDQLPEATAGYLDDHASATRYAIGGPAALAVPDAELLVGADRYATAALVAERFFTGSRVVGVATGASFPDALAAGARLGRMGAPLLLAGDDLTDPVVDVLDTARRVELFGGSQALSTEVEAAVRDLLG